MLERKPEVRRIKINALSGNLAQLASNIVDKCKYIHPSRVEEIEQLLIKLRKHVVSNPDAFDSKGGDDSSQADSTDRDSRDRDRNRDRDRGDRRGNGSSNGGAARQPQGIASSNGGNGRRSQNGGGGGEVFNRDPPAEEKRPRPVVDLLPPASMGELDDYLEMLYQVSGKSEKEREEGLRLQVSPHS